MQTFRLFFVAAAAAGFAAAADAQDNLSVPGDPQAQATRYNVQEMNFDMWCQEQQHLPAERCDKRFPEDDAAFNAYRSKIERYEIPYLQQQQKQLQLNSGILHNDPVDRRDQPPQAQDQPSSAAVPPK
ncbi:MAG TPA: hypothetical protein VHU18_02030 [Rhizomicrobium sp.]|jgi:hypothetical protein|nr:hypothetical protein [Rhizomicrobium sp.]